LHFAIFPPMSEQCDTILATCVLAEWKKTKSYTQEPDADNPFWQMDYDSLSCEIKHSN